MQQTILALGALMIVMITAISQQRSSIMIQELTYMRELENAALDVARIRTESFLSQTDFDEQWINEHHLPSSADPFTPASKFGPEDGETVFDDIDDFHNYSETYSHTVAADTYEFFIKYSVSYVDDAGKPTSARSFAKQITADVVSADTIGIRVAHVSLSKTTIISEDL